MSDTREKLKRLLFDVPCESECEGELGSCPDRKYGKCKRMDRLEYCTVQKIADHLLANGVTVQEWIPVSEPPKEWKHKNGVAINFLVYTPEYGIDIGNYLKPANAWLCMGIPCNATHWTKLPEPPKENAE